MLPALIRPVLEGAPDFGAPVATRFFLGRAAACEPAEPVPFLPGLFVEGDPCGPLAPATFLRWPAAEGDPPVGATFLSGFFTEGDPGAPVCFLRGAPFRAGCLLCAAWARPLGAAFAFPVSCDVGDVGIMNLSVLAGVEPRLQKEGRCYHINFATHASLV